MKQSADKGDKAGAKGDAKAEGRRSNSNLPRPCVRNRHEPVAALRLLAAEERQRKNALPARRRPAVVRSAPAAKAARSTSTSAIRPSRCRTSATSRIGMTREHMVDDQRFASPRPDVLVYQTDVLDEDVTLAGPISAAARVDHRHRFRFCREADRRVLRRFSQSRSESGGVQMGGYQQLVRGEADARQVPQQLSKSRSRSRPAKWPPSIGRCPTCTTPSAAGIAS